MRFAVLLVLASGLIAAPVSAQPSQALSPGFATTAGVYFHRIRALETSVAVEMSRDESREYDQARTMATAAQVNNTDRILMTLLRRYSILVNRWRAMVVETGKTDFSLPPARAQQHATCRHEIDRSLATGVLFPNSQCSAAAR
jgi:hypothetical protein